MSSRSPAYDPLPLENSDKSDGDEETQDQDMVDLTENEALLNIEEPADPYTQEEVREYDSYRYIATVRYRIDGTVRTTLRLYTIYRSYIK